MGDIFRRNSFNLGLHVLECPEAVADAQDGDTFTFDPVTRALVNETQGRAYSRCRWRRRKKRSAATAASSRSAAASCGDRSSARRASSGRTRRVARRLTTTEQILWAHRVDRHGRREVKPGATLRLYADLLPASDGTAPFAIHTFNQITGGQPI